MARPVPPHSGGLLQQFHIRGVATVTNLRGSLFESPFLPQKAFPVGAVRPTVAAGATVRAISDPEYDTVEFIADPGASPNAPRDLPANPYQLGVVFAGGVQINAPARLQFHPQLRYTRWTVRNQWNTNPNQVDFVLGIYFRILK